LVRTLEAAPPIFPTSVRLWRSAGETPDPTIARALRGAGRLADLRKYVFETLDEQERVRLKLSTPIGVAQHLLTRYGRLIADRIDLLEQDRALVENVDGQIRIYGADLATALEP